MITIQQALREAVAPLSQVSETPLLDAEILLAFVLNQPRVFLHAWPEIELSAQQSDVFAEYLKRRSAGEPIAYLTGTKDFWTFSLVVSPHTLIPRPETELIVEAVLNLYENDSPKKVADLGTGSGAIGLAIARERPTWQVYATDINQEALQIANKNAQRLAIYGISFYQGSWCTALPCQDFDVIVSNPPYISEEEWGVYADGLAFEPRTALVSGMDGLDAIRDICHSAKSYLKPGGHILIEHGFLQADAVRRMLASNGYHEVYSVSDLAGYERVTIAKTLPQPQGRE